MRRLWLLRHAKSSWDDPTLEDHDRPLAPRGRDALLAMGAFLDAEGVRPQLVVCSSARRARETLGGVLPALGTALTVRIEPPLYTFDGRALLDEVRALPGEVPEVMLVGHNPAIEELAASLARGGDRLEDLRRKFPTGALAGLALDTGTWEQAAPGCAVLEVFVTPRELR
jgi:phosphohistidine phosphatase